MKLKQSLLMTALAAVLCLSASTIMAQDNAGGGAGAGAGGAAGGRQRNGGGGGGGFGGGNFDPAQFQQQRLERLREQMDVKSDDEWKAIQDRAIKVYDAQQAVFGFRGRGGRGGGGNGGNGGGGGGGGGGRGFGQPSPELEALRTAIENNAPAEQLKTALEKFRTARKAKEDALTKAQDDLKKILIPKQEAVAVVNGLLN